MGDPLKPRTQKMVDEIVAHLGNRAKIVGVELKRSLEPIDVHADLVIVLGGDGAMLATSHRLGRRDIPVMGINIGRIGFLTAFSPERSLKALDRILAGEGSCEAHAMMRATIRRNKEIILDTRILNEVAVVRAWGASMVEVDLTVDRRPVCTYRSDGLIVSTATGSTAYSMSAGGPVLSPRLDAWVVTPIAPHSLNQRPVVLPGSRVAKLRIHSECGFTADGHEEQRLLPDDTIHVSPSKRKFHLVVEPEGNFFARLRSKLLWGESPGPG
ncbi:MAG: NAD(+)/NADH kinase [Planctomycetota bacterium]|nr:NAD(+)/NADH kinase [Planctomycetota bacterium]MDP6940400.1 NAD(+)/NADH kinase [Planctomycetota bacterium]